MDKVSDTPRTDAFTSCDDWNEAVKFRGQEQGQMIRIGWLQDHARYLERELTAYRKETDILTGAVLDLREKLAEQKEQMRVLEEEMLVLGDERNAAEARSNLLACALRALLSKCPNCGGTGEVGTGIIQIGQPVQMPCFVCSGERQIFLRECGK